MAPKLHFVICREGVYYLMVVAFVFAGAMITVMITMATVASLNVRTVSLRLRFIRR